MFFQAQVKMMISKVKNQCCLYFQYALIGNVIVEVLGGIFFFIAAIFVIKDRLRVHEYLASKFVVQLLIIFRGRIYSKLVDTKYLVMKRQ